MCYVGGARFSGAVCHNKIMRRERAETEIILWEK